MNPKKSKTFFLLFISLFLLSFLSVDSVSAYEDYSILTDNFNVSLLPHSNLAIKNKYFKTEISDLSVKSFQNLGIYGYTNDSIVYYADLDLKLIFNVYSAFTYDTIDYDGNTYWNQVKKTYLYLWTFEEESNPATHNYYEKSVSFDDFQFQYYKTFLDSVDLSLSYTPLDSRKFTFKDSEIQASIPKTELEFDKFTVVDENHGEVGQYSDYFTESNSIVLGSIDARTSTESPPSGGDANSELVGLISSYSLGAFTQAISQPLLVQQKVVDGMTEGSTYFIHTSNSMTRTLPMIIQPGIDKYTQKINVRAGHIWADVKDTWLFSPAYAEIKGAIEPTEYTRTVGIHVNNHYIQQELEISCKIFSTLQLDVPLTDSFLRQPEILAGDIIWDATITGESLDLVFSSGFQPSTFFDSLNEFITAFFGFGSTLLGYVIFILVLVGVIMVIVKIVIPLLAKKRIKR